MTTGDERRFAALRAKLGPKSWEYRTKLAARLLRRVDVPVTPAAASPAAFDTWVDHRSPRPPRSFEAYWRELAEWRATPPARIAAAIHVYYPDLLAELLDALRVLPVPVDIIITNASGQELELPEDPPGRILVLATENHGRDILPLVDVVNTGLLDPYDLVLKIHTKESAWRAEHGLPGDGAQWRRELLSSLVGSREQVAAILDAFATDRSLGILTADGSVLGPEYWGSNEAVAANLLRRLELPLVESELVFAAGSMYWARGFLLAGLRALNLSAADFETEAGQVNLTTAHAIERVIGVLCVEAGLRVAERGEMAGASAAATAEASSTADASSPGLTRYDPVTPEAPRVRAIPFFLPQFHAIPENDAWWGEGFTEWTNVTAARPVYRGHYQPRLPRDVGFYDLRMPETVATQTQMAADAGMAGFMYYHYWFTGKNLLERPITDRVSDDNPLPFCLMWANENWTRAWNGDDRDVLLAQSYDEVHAGEFIRSVLHVLADPRYLRMDGKAVLALYRPGQLPDLREALAQWRELAREAGIGELLLLAVDVGTAFDGVEGEPDELGLDGTLGFAPHNMLWQPVIAENLHVTPGVRARIFSYQAMVGGALERYAEGLPRNHYPGVMVAFDNTARRQANPDIWYGSNPYSFYRWLSAAADAVADRPFEERMVYINAWNEWAEAAVLEPSDRFGATYLLAARAAVMA